VPTTQTPTTVAPTEKATTVAPTTVAPTTKIDEDDTIPAPIGLTYAGNKDLPYYFAWQAPSSDIENYNVYVDGVFAGSSVNSSINLTADVFANGNGDYTVSVRSVKNGKMSAATQITYTFKDGTGSKPTTVAPVTTVAPTEKTTTVAPVTTQAPTEKATTAVPTTQAPTTVAPTEKATTVVPTTQAPTTVAPTEKATTVAPTTVAPTTAAPTTAAPTTVAPTTTVALTTTAAPTTTKDTEQETTTNNGAVISVETSSTYKTAEQMEKEILEKKDDKDFANSTFAKLSVRVKKTTKKSVKLVWKKMSGATKYVIYGAKCGTSYKKIKEVSKKTFTANKLKKGKYYKYLVVAQNDKGEVLATSKLIHVATKGGKVGNCKSLKLNKTKVKLLLGKKFKIKVKQIADSKNVKIKKHRKVSFESSNPEIATVSKRGKITALKRGKCTIYAYAQNGVYKKVKVTIK